ncbi:MAG: hypothetical protein JXR96_21150 [Deltaproteobacteria bacterium]|nr:hypothetical protein [Deltaproteobacteria bacterium]
MRAVGLGCALALLCFWSPARSEDRPDGSAVVSVELDREEVRLGEPFRMTIRLRGPSSGQYTLPPSLDLGPFVELSRERRSEVVGDVSVEVFELKIATYEKVGQVELPAFELVAPPSDGGQPAGEPLEVPAAKIRIASLLEGVDKPEPRDIASPVDIFVDDYRLLVLAGLLLLWLLLGLLAQRARPLSEGRPQVADLPPPRLAHEIALEKLEAIVADDLLRKGQLQEYFVRISETLREYLGNRYGFFALDLTSRELVEELRDRPTPGLDMDLLAQLLAEADMVKFARLVPPDSVCSRAMDGTVAIVEATRIRQEAAA